SGDIYDVIRLDDDHLGVFLADAVGHGVSAALMTMVICQSLTTRVADGSSSRILDPADVLNRLNQQMLRQRLHPSRFATAIYAVIDCQRRRATVAAAGHPPPLLVHEGGGVDPLTAGGGLLGVFEDEVYDQVEVDLAVDDRLLLYTDGFEQARPPASLHRRLRAGLSPGGTGRPPRPSHDALPPGVPGALRRVEPPGHDGDHRPAARCPDRLPASDRRPDAPVHARRAAGATGAGLRTRVPRGVTRRCHALVRPRQGPAKHAVVD
ncbi:MAG: PP2C family protein-serine/threonine phosphatase, partial [Planctomycetota bacterium]